MQDDQDWLKPILRIIQTQELCRRWFDTLVRLDHIGKTIGIVNRDMSLIPPNNLVA